MDDFNKKLCVFILFVCSCDLFVQELNFINNSDADIYYRFHISHYRDTILTGHYIDMDSITGKWRDETIEYMILARSKDVLKRMGQWKFSFTSKEDRLHLYVGKKDSIGEIKLVKRYDLSLEDLDKINWVINYPPVGASVHARDVY